MRLLLLLAFALTSFASCRGAELSSLEEEYLKAYLLFNDAENLEQEGDLRSAYKDYSEGLRLLILVQSSDASYIEQDMYQAKLRDAQAKLDELRLRISCQAPRLNSKRPSAKH